MIDVRFQLVVLLLIMLVVVLDADISFKGWGIVIRAKLHAGMSIVSRRLGRA